MQNRDALEGRKIAMYCTGGIRCEKATAYVRSLGLAEVYHLKGGILKYLETVPAEQSLWQGECFVFDERVSVTHGLEPGAAELCRACRRPLTVEDRRRRTIARAFRAAIVTTCAATRTAPATPSGSGRCNWLRRAAPGRISAVESALRRASL